MGEMRLAPMSLYRSRPTLRVDGQEQAMADQLLRAMVLHEQESGLSSMVLSFSNWSGRAGGGAGFAFEDEAIFRFGAELAVYGGEVAGPTELFKGRISALEFAADASGPPQLVVHAEDALQGMRMKRQSKAYEAQSVADIARALASDHGLTPVISGLADSSGTWVQANESDLAFLRRLLARHDADVQVVGRELHVSPRDAVRRNEVELRLASQLQRVRVVADLADQVTELTVTGFDPAQGRSVSGTGSSAPLGPGSGRSGARLLGDLTPERRQQTSHRLALSQAEASALAQDEFARRARRFVRVAGTASGNPGLRVGSHVVLSGLSARFDNSYYVTACTHRYDLATGYLTDFEAESAYLGEAA